MSSYSFSKKPTKKGKQLSGKAAAALRYLERHNIARNSWGIPAKMYAAMKREGFIWDPKQYGGTWRKRK